MKEKRVYLCEDSLEGILTGVYEAYGSRYGHQFIELRVLQPVSYELFTDYVEVKTEKEKAWKVISAIKKKISGLAFQMVYYSALSGDPKKADSIYRFLIFGFSMGRKVVDFLSEPSVYSVFANYKTVQREYDHYQGFLRFSELYNSVLFARMRPKSNLIFLLADHFSDRLFLENWMIYDEGRKIAALHPKSSEWFLTDGSDLNWENLSKFSDSEEQMQMLWRRFVTTIGIKERENEKLRNQMLPKRYREFMGMEQEER